MNALILPGTTESLAQVTGYVLQAAALADLSERATYHLRLAVDEIATNIVTHGYIEAGLTGNLTISAAITQRELTIYLEDTSLAYDPRQSLTGPLPWPAPGFGNLLALWSVDQLDYRTDNGRNRTTFVVHRTSPLTANLLLAGRDPLQRAELARQLQLWPAATLTQAGNSEETLALLHHQPFDLLLLDLNLAAVEHYTLLRRLRLDPQLRQTPIIILAGIADGDRLGRCFQFGAADCLLLPTTPLLFKTRLVIHLEKRQLQAQLDSTWQAHQELRRLADDLVQVILPLGIALSAEKEFDRLLEQIVIQARTICRADAGTLYLLTNGFLRFAIVRTESLGLAYGGSTGRPVPFPPLPLYDVRGQTPNTHHVATHVALTGRSVNIPDVYQAAGFDFSGTKLFDESNHYRSTSCLTIPLGNQEVIGVLQLLNAQDDSGRVIPFSQYHQMVAESLASQAAIVLHNHILGERQQALQEFQRELEIGRQIQTSFLPAELPQPPGWQVAACFRAARLVSGDFYDAFSLPDDKVGLMVADVCDKGMAAALFMALVRSLLHALIQHHYHLKRGDLAADNEGPFLPADTAALLDAVLLTNTYLATNHRQANMFATLFVAILDTAGGNLMYINAGHVPPAVLRDGQIIGRLAPTGPAVGLLPIATFRVRELLLEPGDTLLVYTDGLTEARDLNQTMFGEQRLLELATQPAETTAALLEQIETAVEAHVHLTGLYDDLTMLAVGRSLKT